MSVGRVSEWENYSDLYRDISPEDLELLKSRIKALEEKGLSRDEILALFLSPDKTAIPPTIFSRKLSPLESVVKYLREALDMDFKEISSRLSRSQQALKRAYNNAVDKQPSVFKPTEHRRMIPLSELKANLSILEAVVTYLADTQRLRYADIARLLQRDPRTVWTAHSRAQEKQ